MEKSLLLSALLFISSQLFAQEPQLLTSEIQEITVFRKGAQINRNGKMHLPSGVSEIKIIALSPTMDAQSIKVTSDPQTKILAVNHSINYLSTDKKEEELDGLLSTITLQKESISLLDIQIKTAKQEIEFLNLNRDLKGATENLDFEALHKISTYYAEKMKDLQTQIYHLSRQKEIVVKRQETLSNQYRSLATKREEYTSEIHLKVTRKSVGTSIFDVNYYSDNASWYSNYDIRVQNIAEPVALVHKINVMQNTGEDWKDVFMHFSNAEPSTSAQMPDIVPYYLYPNRRATTNNNISITYPQKTLGYNSVSGFVYDEVGDPLIGANILVKGTPIGTVTNVDGSFSLTLPSDGRRLVVSYTGYETHEIELGNSRNIVVSMQQGITMEQSVVTGRRIRSLPTRSVNKIVGVTAGSAPIRRSEKVIPYQQKQQAATYIFRLDNPYTVASDGKSRTFDLAEHILPAEFEYYTTPKLTESAYLYALITDWEISEIPPGEARVFYENTYIGKTLLDTREISDTLSLSLGVDKGVIVQRELAVDYSGSSFFSGKKKVKKTYDIILRNNKSAPISIKVKDQIPVSNDSRITIEDVDTQKAKLNKETGELEWKETLLSGKDTKIRFSYAVKHPRKMRMYVE